MSTVAGASSLSFGIPSLDGLLGRIEWTPPSGTSISIVGPEGTGKSILALHLAATYAAQHRGSHVIYCSTDLPVEVARRYWGMFCLHRVDRPVPFRNDGDPDPNAGTEAVATHRVRLVKTDPENLANRLAADDDEPGVTFLDLRGQTTGDDWGFLNRTLAALPPREGSTHMLLIDAVDGLDFLSGHQDLHGEPRERRARLAQMLRTASGCHVVLVAGEAISEVATPEEVLSDVAIRLRLVRERSYTRRTVEVVKARGTNPVRGQHMYYIRDGSGSSTGDAENIDDPFVVYPQNDLVGYEDVVPERRDVNGRVKPVVAYVHVCQSTHRSYRVAMASPNNDAYRGDYGGVRVGFGIPYLDSIIGNSEDLAEPEDEEGRRAIRVPRKEIDAFGGWPAGRVSMIVGHKATLKTHLAKHFLAEAFNPENERKYGCGVAVLLTNSDETRARLADWVQQIHSRDDRQELLERIICRRLEVHDMTSSVLAHIVHATIAEAKRRQRDADARIGIRRATSSSGTDLVDHQPWQIRFVLDDWSVVRGMYCDLRADDLFLPYLCFHLNRERISSLIVSTQPWMPEKPPRNRFDAQVQLLADRMLYTWRVPFFGNSRVAVTHLPGIDFRGGTVREVRLRRDGRGERLVVDPNFEMYDGLAKGEPRLVPLRVVLFGQSEAHRAYAKDIQSFLRAVVPRYQDAGVVNVEATEEYQVQRSLLYLQSDRRLDYALVVQVDEFWGVSHTSDVRPHNGLSSLENYLTVSRVGGGQDPFADPLESFFPSEAGLDVPLVESGDRSEPARGSARREPRRADFFRGGGDQSPLDAVHLRDRVPYYWDFGFVVLRAAAWERAADQLLADADEQPRTRRAATVGDVLRRLRLRRAMPIAEGVVRWARDPMCTPLSAIDTEQSDSETVSWSDFLRAATVVARHQTVGGTTSPLPAFDLGLHPGSFPCLVLEVWFSEIFEALRQFPEAQTRFVDQIARRGPNVFLEGGLPALLSNPTSVTAFSWPGYRVELYRALMLLVEAFKHTEFPGLDDTNDFLPRDAGQQATAVRHWYGSAAQAMHDWTADNPMICCRLPGRFSVRGDWFLAVPNASRSKRLAERTLDVLVSRRGVEARLRTGIGLPVRALGSLDPARVEARLIPTALKTIDDDGRRRTLTYEELLRIAARDDPSGRTFFWLFRSQIENYDAHCRVWQRWLHETFAWLRSIQRLQGRLWRSGFWVYDHCNRGREPALQPPLESADQFNSRCETLLNGLRTATVKRTVEGQ